MRYYTQSISVSLIICVWTTVLALAQPARLRVSPNGRCLINQRGEAVFLKRYRLEITDPWCTASMTTLRWFGQWARALQYDIMVLARGEFSAYSPQFSR